MSPFSCKKGTRRHLVSKILEEFQLHDVIIKNPGLRKLLLYSVMVSLLPYIYISIKNSIKSKDFCFIFLMTTPLVEFETQLIIHLHRSFQLLLFLETLWIRVFCILWQHNSEVNICQSVCAFSLISIDRC